LFLNTEDSSTNSIPIPPKPKHLKNYTLNSPKKFGFLSSSKSHTKSSSVVTPADITVLHSAASPLFPLTTPSTTSFGSNPFEDQDFGDVESGSDSSSAPDSLYGSPVKQPSIRMPTNTNNKAYSASTPFISESDTEDPFASPSDMPPALPPRPTKFSSNNDEFGSMPDKNVTKSTNFLYQHGTGSSRLKKKGNDTTSQSLSDLLNTKLNVKETYRHPDMLSAYRTAKQMDPPCQILI
jgi:hypothetical protein